MGFEDRDYYRSETGGNFFAGAGSAVKGLIAVNLVVFLLQILTTGGGTSKVDDALAFFPDEVLHGEVWRLLTYGFGYGGSPLVFFFNMYFLWIFGKTVEEMHGTRELVLFYVAAVLLGGAACTIAALLTGQNVSMMGSSVPSLAVTVVFAWHHPKQQILLFFLIPVEIWIVVTFIVLMNFYNAAMSSFAGGLFIAELTAVAFALLYGWGGKRIEDLVPAGRPRLRMPKPKPKLRVFEPEQKVNLDRQVDEILAKIHEQGESSLTDRERKTLQEASRRYKKT
ncbi:MAG: rhomboid family intramembrane serine protease [Planctomycetota bacterium]|nr:rhomboid family intramembrane serine protease [Planctomycetaceae bacterium]MDQ3330890.1 rhomboid family intramembrane serine protease [Planctomycetota bacterium]